MSQGGQTVGNLSRVVGLGDPVMDIRVEVSHDVLGKLVDGTGGCLPISASEMQRLESFVQDLQHIRVPGGSAANVMKGLANMSDGQTHCTFVGMIGRDTTGQEYKNKLASQGVQPLLLENRRGEPSATALCLVTPDGQRTMRTCLGASLELRSIDMLPTTWLAGARLLHCEGYCLYRRDLTRRAMMAAKQAGAIVSLDLASYELVRNCRDLLLELLQDSLIDLVFANEHEALELVNPLTGPQQLPKVDMEDIIASAQRMLLEHVEVAVVSRGPKGCVASSRGGLAASSPAAVVTVVDTIGAGDTFAAGFLHAYLQGADLQACCACGCAAGAEAVQAVGTDLPACARENSLGNLITYHDGVQGADLQACCACGCAAGAEAVQAVGADLPAASWDRLRRSIAPILAAGDSRRAEAVQTGEPLQGDSLQMVTVADGRDMAAVYSERIGYNGILDGHHSIMLNGHDDATAPSGHGDALLLIDDDIPIPTSGKHGTALSNRHDHGTQQDGQPDVSVPNDDDASTLPGGHHGTASSHGHDDMTQPHGQPDALLLNDDAGSIPPTGDHGTVPPGGLGDSSAPGGTDHSVMHNQHDDAILADTRGGSKDNKEPISLNKAASRSSAHTMDTPAPQPLSSTAEPAVTNDVASLPPTSTASLPTMTGTGGSVAAAGELTPAASPSRQVADKETPPTAQPRSQEARESAMERSRRTLERGQRALALSQQVLAAGQQLAAGHVRPRLPTDQQAAAQHQPSAGLDATRIQPMDSHARQSLRPDQHVAANGQVHAVHADATSGSVLMPPLASSRSAADSQGRDQDRDLDLDQQRADAAAAGSLPGHVLPGAVADVTAAASKTDRGAQHRGGKEVQQLTEPRKQRPRRHMGLMLTATAGLAAAIVRFVSGRA